MSEETSKVETVVYELPRFTVKVVATSEVVPRVPAKQTMSIKLPGSSRMEAVEMHSESPLDPFDSPGVVANLVFTLTMLNAETAEAWQIKLNHHELSELITALGKALPNPGFAVRYR